MSQDFGKGKIYKITNDYNDDIYIGSTCDLLTKRFSKHKNDSKNEKKKNSPIYKLMNEIGYERFRIELIENYPCQDKYQLIQREGHYIRELGTLNKRIEGRSQEEYKKEYQKEKNTCSVCGSIVFKSALSRHIKSNKHQSQMPENYEN